MKKMIKIPESRLGVLISCKREIEKHLDAKIYIDRNENEISIDGEALAVMDAENIITSIGRGFSPEKALKLVDENNILCIVYLPKDEKKLKRLKSRIIGEDGRSRKTIEELTDTDISIFGKTVSIIGNHEAVENVKTSIEMFIKGFSHRAIYAFLEKKNAQMRKYGQ